MCLDIVNVGLLQISQVAEAHFGISYRQVDGKHLSQRRLIVQGGKFYYSTRISQREYLVIRLSVVGREHHSHNRQIDLITKHHRIPFDFQVPNSHSGGIQIDVCSCGCRIVGVPEIIDKASVDIYQSSG